MLSKLDIKISNPIKAGNDVEYKIWIIQKFNKERVYIIQNHFQKFPKALEGEPSLADVIEMVREIIDVPESFEEYCDIVVGANEDDPIDRIDYQDYRKRADRLSKGVTKREITSIPVLRILPEGEFIDEKDEENKDLIDEIKKHNLRRVQSHRINIVRVSNLYDNNRLEDYVNSLQHYKKLMKQYGYDEITEEFNYKLFPVPKEDRELTGIKKDIDDFFKLLDEYNDYIRYLVQKYDGNIGEEELRTRGIIILHEPKLSNNSLNM
jgi:hypothetical protein